MRILSCTVLLLVLVSNTPAYAQSLASGNRSASTSANWERRVPEALPVVFSTVDSHQRISGHVIYDVETRVFRISRDTNAMQKQMPRWLKWGLIGAAGGAVTFAVLGRMTIDDEPNSLFADAALGAVAGFVVIGGAIAVYDAVCGPDSSSRRAGLC